MNIVFITNNFLNRNRIGIAVSILLFLFSYSIFSQSSDVPFDYPIKPGTLEWAKFQSHTDMINACQIPGNILKSISTKALIKTCLQYPLLVDIFAYDDFQVGFEHVASNFNGLRELFQRPDLAESTLQEYIDMSDVVSPEVENIHDQLQFMRLEMFLSQPQIIKNLSIPKKKRLLSEAMRKFSAMSKLPERYGCFSLTPSCLIMARLLGGQLNSGKIESDLKVSRFADKPFIADTETINTILGAAEKYLSN
jgi:hypothetical protein